MDAEQIIMNNMDSLTEQEKVSLYNVYAENDNLPIVLKGEEALELFAEGRTLMNSDDVREIIATFYNVVDSSGYVIYDYIIFDETYGTYGTYAEFDFDDFNYDIAHELAIGYIDISDQYYYYKIFDGVEEEEE